MLAVQQQQGIPDRRSRRLGSSCWRMIERGQDSYGFGQVGMPKMAIRFQIGTLGPLVPSIDEHDTLVVVDSLCQCRSAGRRQPCAVSGWCRVCQGAKWGLMCSRAFAPSLVLRLDGEKNAYQAICAVLDGKSVIQPG
jgi:hypothetical protein